MFHVGIPYDIGMRQPGRLVPYLMRLPESLHRRLRERAEKEDRTMASIVRRALKGYLDEH